MFSSIEFIVTWHVAAVARTMTIVKIVTMKMRMMMIEKKGIHGHWTCLGTSWRTWALFLHDSDLVFIMSRYSVILLVICGAIFIRATTGLSVLFFPLFFTQQKLKGSEIPWFHGGGDLKKFFQVPSSAGSVDDVGETTPGLEVSVKTGSNLRKFNPLRF